MRRLLQQDLKYGNVRMKTLRFDSESLEFAPVVVSSVNRLQRAFGGLEEGLRSLDGCTASHGHLTVAQAFLSYSTDRSSEPRANHRENRARGTNSDPSCGQIYLSFYSGDIAARSNATTHTGSIVFEPRQPCFTSTLSQQQYTHVGCQTEHVSLLLFWIFGVSIMAGGGVKPALLHHFLS